MTSTFKKLIATALVATLTIAPALSHAAPLASPQAPALQSSADTLKAIDTIGALPMTDEAASEVRGEANVKAFIRVVDWLGRVTYVYDGIRWVTGANLTTCFYSSTANSTPYYCY